jgi:hypothetical protein
LLEDESGVQEPGPANDTQQSMSPLSTPPNSDDEDGAQEPDEEADAEDQDPSSLNPLMATEDDTGSNIHPSLRNEPPATPPRFIAQRADGLLSDSTAVGKTRSGASRERGKRTGPADGDPGSPSLSVDLVAADKALCAHNAGARKHTCHESVASSGRSFCLNQPPLKV